jgi:nucleoid-associated protein YgaU
MSKAGILKGKHKVKLNETLSHIAQEHYNKVDYWKGLLKANKETIKKYDLTKGYALITPGQEINLPEDSIVKLYTDNINQQIALSGADDVTLDF